MTENNIPFKQKIKEGIELSRRLKKFSLEIAKNISQRNDTDKSGSNRRAVLKGFLLSASQLCEQIIIAVSQRCLSLAVVGSRSMLEFSINANYIFDNPKHKNDLKWVNKLCKDIFERTNDIGMLKSRLGDVTFKARAEEIGRLDLYKHNYASLSDYVHLVLRHPFLQKIETFEKTSVGIISQSLCNMVGVVDAAIVFNGFEWEKELKKDVECFRDRYE